VSVSTYTAIGTPQHGSAVGCLTVPDQCPNGAVQRKLNSGDDTPQPSGKPKIYYTSMGSTEDPVERDGSLTALAGADCLPRVAGGLHATEPMNRNVIAAVQRALRRACSDSPG
jgi:hypothetical protein